MDPNESAERAVLARIFQRFPHSFVWIGRSVLQLIHRSARSSHDLDLTPTGELPLPSGLQTEINNALIEWNGLEVQSFALEEKASPSDFKRFTVTNQGKHAFTIDIVRMGGASLSGTHTVLLSSSLGSATVVIPNDSTLLDQKVKAFLCGLIRSRAICTISGFWWIAASNFRPSSERRWPMPLSSLKWTERRLLRG